MLSMTVQIFVGIMQVLILVRILASWFRPRYRTATNGWFFAIDDMVYRATEPLLAPIRNLLPGGGGMGLDFSPLILLLLLRFVGTLLVQLLASAGL